MPLDRFATSSNVMNLTSPSACILASEQSLENMNNNEVMPSTLKTVHAWDLLLFLLATVSGTSKMLPLGWSITVTVNRVGR